MVKFSACDYRVVGNVAILTCENLPVNQLSIKLRNGLLQGVNAACSDQQVKALVLIGGGRSFIAGADIKEFQNGDFYRGAQLNTIMTAFEESKIPIVAAIHGYALGGGLEMAMACHYRLGSSLCKVGQPEVSIGLIPGAGGTQRLPRLCGPMLAAELCSSGKQVNATKALECGILDKVVTCTKGNEYNVLLEAAMAYAKEVMYKPLAPRVVGNMPCEKMDETFVNKLMQKVNKKARNRNAPMANIEAVLAATKLPFREGMKEEQRIFQNLMVSAEAKALQHVFFAQRACAKIPGIDTRTAAKVKSIGIIGCGTMGGGIAMCYAQKGIPVTILEIKQEYIDRGMNVIHKNWMRGVKKGRMTNEQVKGLMNLIKPTLRYEDLSEVDLVIEAAFESMDIKKKVFQMLDKHCKPSCILASNTSTLNIDTIASFTSRPDKVCGMHFFSPANVMKLLENIRGAKSSPSTLATAMQMGKFLKKVPVMVGNCHGFVGNRLFAPYQFEAATLILEGASPMKVDRALYNFGMAMGPIATVDLVGLDVQMKVRKAKGIFYPEKRPRGMVYPFNVQEELIRMKRLGQKTGKGIYEYEGRKRIPSEMVASMFAEERRKLGVSQVSHSDQDIVERCLFPLINEGLKCLEDGIAMRPLDIDVIWIFGYGFPNYRGGPMHWADTVGMKRIRDTMRKWGSDKPRQEQYHPCKLLNYLADESISLADYTHEQAKSKL